MPGPQPLAQRLGLRVEPRRARDALAEDALDDEVEGAQVRQHVPGHTRAGRLGEQLLKRSTVSVCASQRQPASRARPHADVGAAALVAAAGAGDGPSGTAAGRPGRRAVRATPAPATAASGSRSGGAAIRHPPAVRQHGDVRDSAAAT